MPGNAGRETKDEKNAQQRPPMRLRPKLPLSLVLSPEETLEVDPLWIDLFMIIRYLSFVHSTIARTPPTDLMSQGMLEACI